MSVLEQRRKELLLESEMNRQVLHLEAEQLRSQIGQMRMGVLSGKWKFLAPLAGMLMVWKFKKMGGFLKSGVGLLLLRKAYDKWVRK